MKAVRVCAILAVALVCFGDNNMDKVHAQDSSVDDTWYSEDDIALIQTTAQRMSSGAVTVEKQKQGKREKHPILIVEGDSWFDLPWSHTDVSDVLEDREYAVMSKAKRGDTLEDMAFGNQLAEIASLFLEIRDRYKKTPRAILLSMGGNDILGPNLAFVLNHRSSSIGAQTPWMKNILHGALQRFRLYVIDYITAVSLTCKAYHDDGPCMEIPIIIHGYDYPMPSGKGFKFLWFTVKGPWLKPSFDMKGYSALEAQKTIQHFVNEYNLALESAVTSVKNMNLIPNPVCYLKLLKTVGENQWADELHPNTEGMSAIADKFIQKIEACN